jgi:hypothetical protein
MLFFWRVRMEGLQNWFSEVMYIINRKQKTGSIFQQECTDHLIQDPKILMEI